MVTTENKPRKQRKQHKKAKSGSIQRGPGISVKSIVDKKLRGKLRHSERIYREAHVKATKVNEWLQPAEQGYIETDGVERTWNIKQDSLKAVVEAGASKKAFDLKLPDLGPYKVDFTRNGRHVLLGGRKGHLAMMDLHTKNIHCEVQVQETTRDVCFLHNETFFAAAQKKYVYIYDKRGIEIHCLREHIRPNVLEFLPHHFLLASTGQNGVLHYQDTSTGHIVATHRTQLGSCSVMRQNPWNAVLGCGHAGGVVTMWTPNITQPVVKMLCHRGPVNAVAFDLSGRYMVTAGADSQVKVWDVRTFKPMNSYFSFSPAQHLDVSQRGLLAVGYGSKVQMWRDALENKAASPYMTHRLLDGEALADVHFVPYEDAIGIGSSLGFSSAIVPGAGEPNFDSYVANPFASLKERREGEVASLLDKLQPSTIVLDPTTIGRVRKEPLEVQRQKQAEARAANEEAKSAQRAKNESKDKKKGKNKPSRRHRKKLSNVIDDKKPDIRSRIQQEEKQKRQKNSESQNLEGVPRALERFFRR